MIELFSMYCPHCQQAAPHVNELFEKMEERKRPDLKVVIIGIGANNTDLEVETFRQGYNIAFPLFSDSGLSIYKILKAREQRHLSRAKKRGTTMLSSSGNQVGSQILLSFLTIC